MKADMSIPGGGLPPFWQISENPAPGLGWSKFGPVHWIWLAAGAAAIAALLFLYKRLGDKGRRIMAWTIVVLQLLNEVDTQAMLIATGQWNVSDLPLHLCSLTEFIFLAHVIRPKSRPLSAVVYGVGYPAAAFGLALPTWSALPVWNFAAIHSFVFHFVMVLYTSTLFIDGYRPRLADLKAAALPLAAGVISIFVFNKLAGTDFLYINGGKHVAFLEALVRSLGVYGYLIVFPALLAVIWTAMFLPFELHARRAEARKKAESGEQSAEENIAEEKSADQPAASPARSGR